MRGKSLSLGQRHCRQVATRHGGGSGANDTVLLFQAHLLLFARKDAALSGADKRARSSGVSCPPRLVLSRGPSPL